MKKILKYVSYAQLIIFTMIAAWSLFRFYGIAPDWARYLMMCMIYIYLARSEMQSIFPKKEVAATKIHIINCQTAEEMLSFLSKIFDADEKDKL